MPLSETDYDTLENDIRVTSAPEFNADIASNSDNNISTAYNALAAPDFWVWRTAVTVKEVYEKTTDDATTWSWTIYIARSVGERDAWREMTSSNVINPSLASVRSGVADIFSGAGGANQRTHLLTVGRRKATRAEKLFATGTGSTAAPATLAFEGNLRSIDIAHALRNVPLP